MGCNVTTVEHDPEWAHLVSGMLAGTRAKYELRAIPPQSASTPSAYRSKKYCDPSADFSEYVCSIKMFSDESFDVITVDGRCRVACVQAAVSKVRRGGLLILDNSDRREYRDVFKILRTWKCRRYLGLLQSSTDVSETAFFKRP
jgi:hypothetical protein